MTSAVFTVPSSWRVVTPGGDAAAAVARAVDEMFAGHDRDSSAVTKHWMRERLTRAVTQPADVDAEVVLFAFPQRPEAGVVLPVSATVLRSQALAVPEGDDPMRVLAGLAAREATSTTLEVLGSLALRTHEVRDAARAFGAEVDEAPVTAEERAQLHAEATSVPLLRVRYMLPANPGRPWHLVVFTALLGSPEPALVDLYLGLFDAFVQAMREEAA